MELLIKCQANDTLPLDQLTEFQGELKNLTEKNYQKFKTQLLELGFSAPFFVWKNNGKNYLLDGHQRKRTLTQMQKEGAFIPPLPVVYVEAKDRKEAKKKVLAFTSQYGQMTDEGLSAFAIDAELNLQDLDSFHFPEIKLDKFQIDDGSDYDAQCDEDEVPEKVEPRCKLGDIWKLGEHRLMCGDSTYKATVEKLMNGEKADLYLTDCPYGVSMEAREKSSSSWVNKDRVHSKIENDDRPLSEMKIFWRQVAEAAIENCSDEASYYWFACQGGDQMMMMMMSLGDAGWAVKHELIWVKDQMCFGRADYHYKHEPIIYGWKRRGKHNWYGDRKQVSVINCDRPKKSDLHPTMKPIELIEHLLNNSSQGGHKILDTFGGSGSTLIACEKTNRKCFMMELDPHYCDVIIERWQKFSGKIAEKVSE